MSSNRKAGHQGDFDGHRDCSCSNEYLIHVKNDQPAAPWFEESAWQMPGSWLMFPPLARSAVSQSVCCLARGEPRKQPWT